MHTCRHMSHQSVSEVNPRNGNTGISSYISPKSRSHLPCRAHMSYKNPHTKTQFGISIDSEGLTRYLCQASAAYRQASMTFVSPGGRSADKSKLVKQPKCTCMHGILVDSMLILLHDKSAVFPTSTHRRPNANGRVPVKGTKVPVSVSHNYHAIHEPE